MEAEEEEEEAAAEGAGGEEVEAAAAAEEEDGRTTRRRGGGGGGGGAWEAEPEVHDASVGEEAGHPFEDRQHKSKCSPYPLPCESYRIFFPRVSARFHPSLDRGKPRYHRFVTVCSQIDSARKDFLLPVFHPPKREGVDSAREGFSRDCSKSHLPAETQYDATKRRTMRFGAF